jgi:hypothetical protein
LLQHLTTVAGIGLGHNGVQPANGPVQRGIIVAIPEP